MENNSYHRYHIETTKASNIIPHPYRFNVKVNRLGLAKLLLRELFHYKGNSEVVLSRPCVYGVFSGPIGGFAPREELCVGCLRCTTQYPEMVQILHNPAYRQLGDDYFTFEQVDTVVHEAEHGRIPIKGAGYRGKFGGEGWDGMWTDMSEIVRPTRDGIHGREFISTQVDIGTAPPSLQFDEHRQPIGPIPQSVSIPIPILFDVLPVSNKETLLSLCKAAAELQTFVVVPVESIIDKGSHIIPLVTSAKQLANIGFDPVMIEMQKWDPELFQQIRKFAVPILRMEYESDLLPYYQQGIRIFHFIADYHGRTKSGTFVREAIREAHQTFVRAQCRDAVTLIGSGGIVAAEHLPKAIISGLDAVALDTPLLVALQAAFKENSFQLPSFNVEWGTQRLKNLTSSWRDQLLEILGAMGLREVRRLRGEVGRSMLQKDLENEAFSGIAGYEQ